NGNFLHDPLSLHKCSCQTSCDRHAHGNQTYPAHNANQAPDYWIFLHLNFHCHVHTCWSQNVYPWHTTLAPKADVLDESQPKTIYSSVQIPSSLRLNKRSHNHQNLFYWNQSQFFADLSVRPVQHAHH